MTSAATDEMRYFSPDARRAVARAEAEARQLGHRRVGTEHLLLGLLAVEGTLAADLLREGGATLVAARHKVLEAIAGDEVAVDGDLPRSPRAARALGRSVRFSHAARSSTVDPEHVLLGVLDVEGAAGQVLRGLGVDVERLRAGLKASGEETATTADSRDEDDPSSATEAAPAGPPPLLCPACATALDDAVTYRVLVANGPRGPREVVAYSCGACGHVLGAGPSHVELRSP